MKNIKSKSTLGYFLNILFILISVIILIYPALYNGYPLLYSDSASYIVSGHLGTVPIDRPIMYGLFVRHISMSYSLWFVVIAQALIIVGLIQYTFYLFVKSGNRSFYSFLTILLLGFLTGLPNYVCQIMPDLFTGVMIWSLVLLFFANSKVSKIVLFIMISFSAIVHNSNLLTVSLIVSFIIIVAYLFRIQQMKKQVPVLVPMVIFLWLLVPTINYSFEKEWYVSKSGNIFTIAKMIETGIVKDYLDEECDKNNYELCQFKDNLPKHAYEFIWNEDSPLYNGDCEKDGGWSTCWKLKNDEYKKIIWGVLMKPHLLIKYIRISAVDVWKQITYFDMIHFSDLGGKGSPFDDIINRYFDDYNLFVKSKQYTQTIFYSVQNSIQRFAIPISLLVLILLAFVKNKEKDKMLKVTLIVLSIGLLINATICSTLAVVEGRYQGRVIWLIPFLCCLLIAMYLGKKKKIKT